MEEFDTQPTLCKVLALSLEKGYQVAIVSQGQSIEKWFVELPLHEKSLVTFPEGKPTYFSKITEKQKRVLESAEDSFYKKENAADYIKSARLLTGDNEISKVFNMGWCYKHMSFSQEIYLAYSLRDFYFLKRMEDTHRKKPRFIFVEEEELVGLNKQKVLEKYLSIRFKRYFNMCTEWDIGHRFSNFLNENNNNVTYEQAIDFFKAQKKHFFESEFWTDISEPEAAQHKVLNIFLKKVANKAIKSFVKKTLNRGNFE